MRMSDLPTVSVETVIEAPAGDIYAVITDLDALAGFGTEFRAGRWVSGSPGAVGSCFVGRNGRDDREWETTSTVVTAEPDREFAWAVNVDDAGDALATWRFHLRSVPDGTEVRFTAVMGPGESGLTAAIARSPEAEEEIISRRLQHHQENMVKTLEGVRRRVERR